MFSNALFAVVQFDREDSGYGTLIEMVSSPLNHCLCVWLLVASNEKIFREPFGVGDSLKKTSYLFGLSKKKLPSLNCGTMKHQHGKFGRGEMLMKSKLVNGLCFPMPFPQLDREDSWYVTSA